MTRKLILLLTLLLIFSCKDQGDEKSENLIKNSDGEIYIAILENKEWGKNKTTFLTKNEVETINKILPKAVEQINKDIKNLPFEDYQNIQVNLNNYKRQYLPYISEKTGEKEVYINCLCRVDDDSWKMEEIIVYGGGECYFTGRINLETEKFYNFMINGPR